MAYTPRIDEGQVIKMLGTNYDIRLQPTLRYAMRQANVLVNTLANVLLPKYKPWLAPMDSDVAREVELNLACHNYQMADPGYLQRSTDQASGGFMVQKGNGLERTDYGKNALLLDYTGILEAVDKRKVATAFWAGTVPDDAVNDNTVQDTG